MDTNIPYRMEYDTLGNIMVSKTAYYGSQTARAVENFPISGLHLPDPFIKAQGIIKAACATVNVELGSLPPDIGKAIIQASEEVISGKWNKHFVVDIYQAGAGTSQNINANEVIANRASEILNNSTTIHPNDHVNMSQSTNDTFPSALNIAACDLLINRLLPALSGLHRELSLKSQEFMHVLKAGRTHLHDGIPIRLGQEFSGYAETIKCVANHVNQRLDFLYEIGIGGKAIGTKMKLNPAYIPKVIQEIGKRTNLPFREPPDIFAFMQNMRAPINCMLTLKELAIHLIKITSDLRLLSSGPRTGLAEITLPTVQPGSTIMPGKVNPAILEMTHMVSCQVIGYETAVSTAGMGAQLEINVFMPLIAHCLLHSIEILSNAINTLTNKCIKGIQANIDKCIMHMKESLALVTGLSQNLGYDMASLIGMKADEENKTIKQILEENGIVNDELLNLLNPEKML